MGEVQLVCISRYSTSGSYRKAKLQLEYATSQIRVYFQSQGTRQAGALSKHHRTARHSTACQSRRINSQGATNFRLEYKTRQNGPTAE
jgi:hypothetical protein